MAKNKLYLILFGLAGSGKGTQAELIKKNFKAVSIAPGDLLREKIKNNELPKDVAESIQKGSLASASLVTDLVLEEIKKHEMDESLEVIILDGFPRSVSQDESFRQKFVGKKGFFAIYFKIEKDSLLERLSERFYCTKCNAVYNKRTKPTKVPNVCDVCGGKDFSSRVDDADMHAIEKRFDTFNKETKPVIDKYQEENNLYTIDASMSVDDVFREVNSVFVKLKSDV